MCVHLYCAITTLNLVSLGICISLTAGKFPCTQNFLAHLNASLEALFCSCYVVSKKKKSERQRKKISDSIS